MSPPLVPRSRPATALERIIGDSSAIRDVRDQIRACADSPWPVAILGESGTGKELVAEAICSLSPFQPLVRVNCATIQPTLAESTLFGHGRGAFTGATNDQLGVFDQVGSGTLFLDEFGDLDPAVQVKLLRAVENGTYRSVGGDQESHFRGRLVIATDQQIWRPEVLRPALYHRVSTIEIRMPPLRDRRRDIPSLARHILTIERADLEGFSPSTLGDDTLAWLMDQRYPGNVRTLRDLVRRGLLHARAERCTRISPRHCAQRTEADTPQTCEAIDFDTAVRRGTLHLTWQLMRSALRQAEERGKASQKAAAELLNISNTKWHREKKKLRAAGFPTSALDGSP